MIIYINIGNDIVLCVAIHTNKLQHKVLQYLKIVVTLKLKNMLVIEKKMLKAIENGKNFRQANTEVEFSKLVDGDFSVYLFGHRIAYGNRYSKTVAISHCGYPTVTTKSRLNALITGRIVQRSFVWYMDGKEFKNEMICDLNI